MGALVYDVGMEEDPSHREAEPSAVDERRRAEYNRGICVPRTEFSPIVFTIVTSVTPDVSGTLRAQESDNVAGRVAKLGLPETGKCAAAARDQPSIWPSTAISGRLDRAVVAVLDPHRDAQALLGRATRSRAPSAPPLATAPGSGARQLGVEVAVAGDQLRVGAHGRALARQQLAAAARTWRRWWRSGSAKQTTPQPSVQVGDLGRRARRRPRATSSSAACCGGMGGVAVAGDVPAAGGRTGRGRRGGCRSSCGAAAARGCRSSSAAPRGRGRRPRDRVARPRRACRGPGARRSRRPASRRPSPAPRRRPTRPAAGPGTASRPSASWSGRSGSPCQATSEPSRSTTATCTLWRLSSSSPRTTVTVISAYRTGDAGAAGTGGVRPRPARAAARGAGRSRCRSRTSRR